MTQDAIYKSSAINILGTYEVQATASSIISMQARGGAIPKTYGGSVDPWNHLEAAMALTTVGRIGEARKAILWLAEIQNPNGSWYSGYDSADNVLEYRIDTNQCVYIATTLLHHFLFTGDLAFLVRLWPTIAKAVNFVISYQTKAGNIPWSIDGEALCNSSEVTPYVKEEITPSLLASSCSIHHSLRAAYILSNILAASENMHSISQYKEALFVDYDPQYLQPIYLYSRFKLFKSINEYVYNRPNTEEEIYLNKDNYAMDNYYPMMTFLTSDAAVAKMVKARDLFILDDWGVRCLVSQDWFTTAETSEWAIAEMCLGNRVLAKSLLISTYRHRLQDGSYLTGSVYPTKATFPRGEVSSYSSAAVILANDILAGGITKQVFTDSKLSSWRAAI